jgi:hypothetical protein
MGGTLGSGGTTEAGGARGTGGVLGTGGLSGTGGVPSSGGATGGAQGDAATDVRSDVAVSSGGAPATGGTGVGGAGSGGAGAGGIFGTGGALADAGQDSGGDTRPDLQSDAGRDSSSDLVVTPSDARTSDGAPCPYAGHVTYTLAKSATPTAAEQTAYALITPAMDKAVDYYNCYTNITKSLNVSYNSGVPTADGNINGSIRFGGTAYMEYITAMHEIGHTVGVGTASNWRSLVAIPAAGGSGPWTGTNANAQLRAITGVATDTLTADTMHFWPYGLNYTSEVKSEADVINHCKIVVAMRKDLGL